MEYILLAFCMLYSCVMCSMDDTQEEKLLTACSTESLVPQKRRNRVVSVLLPSSSVSTNVTANTPEEILNMPTIAPLNLEEAKVYSTMSTTVTTTFSIASTPSKTFFHRSAPSSRRSINSSLEPIPSSELFSSSPSEQPPKMKYRILHSPRSVSSSPTKTEHSSGASTQRSGSSSPSILRPQISMRSLCIQHSDFGYLVCEGLAANMGRVQEIAKLAKPKLTKTKMAKFYRTMKPKKVLSDLEVLCWVNLLCLSLLKEKKSPFKALIKAEIAPVPKPNSNRDACYDKLKSILNNEYTIPVVWPDVPRQENESVYFQQLLQKNNKKCDEEEVDCLSYAKHFKPFTAATILGFFFYQIENDPMAKKKLYYLSKRPDLRTALKKDLTSTLEFIIQLRS